METILNGVKELGGDPRAWFVATLVALKALHTVYLALRCPVMRGVYSPSPETIEKARTYQFNPTLRFLAMMLGGMTLAIGGLYMMNNANYGALALGCIVIGLFMFMTEPSRVAVTIAKTEVFASTGGEGEANELARDRLRGAYRSRATTEVVIVAAVLAMLWYL